MNHISNRYLATLLLSMTAKAAMAGRPSMTAAADSGRVVNDLSVKVFSASAIASHGHYGSPELLPGRASARTTP